MTGGYYPGTEIVGDSKKFFSALQWKSQKNDYIPNKWFFSVNNPQISYILSKGPQPADKISAFAMKQHAVCPSKIISFQAQNFFCAQPLLFLNLKNRCITINRMPAQKAPFINMSSQMLFNSILYAPNTSNEYTPESSPK